MPTGKEVIEAIFREPSMMDWGLFVKRLKKRPALASKRKRRVTAMAPSLSNHAVLDAS
jgi:hypothetical protein